MTIELFNNTSDNNNLNKSLTSHGNKQCDIKGEIDLIRPTFVVGHVSNQFKDCNYCYVPDYGRYYYITNKKGLLGNRMMLECVVDPLMSFKDAIKEMSVIADRANASIRNPYFDNGTLVNDCKHTKQIINFNNGFSNSGCYILLTCGIDTMEV